MLTSLPFYTPIYRNLHRELPRFPKFVRPICVLSDPNMPIKKRSRYTPKNERLHLNGKLIERMCRADCDYHVKDDEVRKLHVKVTPAGAKTFLLRYRNADGVERKLKLGNFPDMNVTTARRLASENLLRVSQGSDPSADKSAKRRGDTFQEFSDRFMIEYAEVKLRPKSIQNYRQILNGALLPHLGGKKMRSITRSDLQQFQKSYRHRKYQANRAVMLTRRIFNYAEEMGDVPENSNPAKGVTLFKEDRRERLLSKDEMNKIGDAIRKLSKEKPNAVYAYRAIQTLFLTGCRTGEALRLRWSGVDFERETLNFPQTKTEPRKQDMTDELIELLRDLQSQNFSEWVFPGRDPGKHLTDLKKSWTAILREAEIDGVRLHDIRHTIISDLANNTDLATAAAIAGHKTIRATAIYVHARSESIKHALSAAAAQNAGLIIKD